MNIPSGRLKATVLACAAALTVAATASAADDLAALKAEVAALKQEVKQAGEWKSPNTLVHMAGYADVGYTDTESTDGSFNVGRFAPIFHYQYRDLVMLESELEFEVAEDGETDVALEYLTVDWFLNDYMTLVAGRFLSPIGQFRQNFHPSWINKLPSAPMGFMHDGAAPVSDVGLQLRGGLPAGTGKLNYALYVSNGPELVSEDGEVEGIMAEGFNTDADGEKTFGGRLGYLPIPSLEVGLSAATGKATVTSVEGVDNSEAAVAADLANETARDYDVFGADLAYRWKKSLDVRGEYVQTKIGDAVGSASEGGEWTTWYLQGAWKFASSNFEAVVRYGEFDSPHAAQDREQWALGLNYWLASNAVAKVAYEMNDNPNAGLDADNRTLVQLAYGF